MRIAITKPLFSWADLDDSPPLNDVRDLLASIPDTRLLSSLRAHRGKGRNDYPVEVLWGVVLLTVFFRHTSFESTLGELSRNEALCELIGIKSPAGIPKKWNISRFLKRLGSSPHRELTEDVFKIMVERLASEIKDLGRECAADATHLSARCGRSLQKSDKLPEPSGGRKEYTDDKGNVTRIVEWFGYKLHLLVDSHHEVALSYKVSSTKTGDNTVLPKLVDQAEDVLGEDRIKVLAYDKAADDRKVYQRLEDSHIKPVIENRSHWPKDGDSEQKLPGHDGNSNIVYDESGTIYCYDTVSRIPVRRRMAYMGYEPSRGTLKYRCPARHYGFRCPSEKICNGGKAYGKTLRVKREIDLRRFPPIPRATKRFEREYKKRSSVERVNGRLKVFWGADDGNITGAERFHGYIGAVMITHLAFATLLASAPKREGTLGKMRLSHIANALRKKTGPQLK